MKIDGIARKSKEFEDAQLQKAIRRSITEEKGMKETFDPKKELVPESEEKKELREANDLKELLEQERVRREIVQRMDLLDKQNERQLVSELGKKIEDLIAQKERDQEREEAKRNSILSLLGGFNQAKNIIEAKMELDEETKKELLEERNRIEYSREDSNHRVIIIAAKIEAAREILHLIEGDG